MKKVRIMLMAICLVAVAGGVLAFKAMVPRDVCTNSAITTTVGGPQICPTTRDCPNLTNTAYTTTTLTTNVFCTTIPATTLVGTETVNVCTTTVNGQPVNLKCASTKATIDPIEP